MTDLEKDIHEWAVRVHDPTMAGQFAKLGEEHGELVEAYIKHLGSGDPYSTVEVVASELADMAIVLSNMASILGCSLSNEMAKKHAFNKTRPDHQPVKVTS